jgi:hypothetical protein
MADALPPHYTFSHAIDLKDGMDPPWGPIFAISTVEPKALHKYLDEMLRMGKIRPSNSLAGTLILFIPKAHRNGLRHRLNHRGLNKFTVLNRYSLLLMNELRDRVQGTKLFTKIDLKAGYNLIRICTGDEWKIAFRTRYGDCEYLVMPFGIANTSVSFQNMTNEIFKDMIELGVVTYINDILIYIQKIKRNMISSSKKYSVASKRGT